MKRISSTVTLCMLAGLLLGACRNGDGSPVIATINGRAVHREEFERFLSLRMGELTATEGSDSIRSQMLDEYIRRRLVLNEAARVNLTVAEGEVEQLLQENPQARSAAAAAGTHEEIVNDLIVEKYYKQVLLKDVRVAPEEIQRYIEQNQDRLTDKPGFYVREIRVQSRQEAERLRKEVIENRRDFASVARLHSDAPNSERGGLARYQEGQLPPVLERAIAPLGPGDVSEVVQSSFGFHLFRLERRMQHHAPEERRSQLDDRRAQLAEELITRKNQQSVDEALDRLTSAAAIEINGPALGFTYTGSLRHN